MTGLLLGFSFVHPAILGGLALAGLPIIIHILNRRRFKSMDWAAMDFLLKAAVRNRRRVRLENLLLLALRTLMVVVLVVLVARPFSKREDAFASLFGAEGAVERVILLDDSHSMRAGQGNRSSFAAAKQYIKALVERLHDERSPDHLSLVLGSRPRKGGEGLARVRAASAQYTRLLRALDELRPTDASFDVAKSIEAILDTQSEKEARVVVHLVSDFRSRDWLDPDGAVRPDVARALDAVAAIGSVRLVDVGANPVQNVGVVDLRPADRAVIAGVPATFVATVRNHGPEPVGNVQVSFEFGQTRVPVAERLDRELQPGEQAEIKKTYTFRTDGPVVVSAKTPTDVLPGDDTRRRVVDVRRSMRFLLVDGEPDPEQYRSETDFLAAALMPPGNTSSGVEVEVVSEYGFSGRELDTYDGVFLCNVYRLPDERLKRLEEFVKAGGGLVFFVGDQVDPQVYNATFYGRGEEAGKSLLPVPLREVEGSTESFFNPAAPAVDHPVAAFMRGMNQIILRTVAVQRFIRADVPARGDARVILSLSDPDGSPLLVEKSYGEGRVLLFLTAADDEWSDFPRSPLYLMLLLESARYIVKPDPDAYTLPVGAAISVRYDPRRIGSQVAIVPPAEMGGAPIRLLSEQDPDSKQLFYRYDGTDVAGVYTMKLQTPEGEDFDRPYALNVDPSEGDLRRAELTPIAQAAPGTRIERAGDEGALDTNESDRTEFWRTLVWCLVAMAALETLLAWRFGHHKTTSARTEEGKQVFVR